MDPAPHTETSALMAALGALTPIYSDRAAPVLRAALAALVGSGAAPAKPVVLPSPEPRSPPAAPVAKPPAARPKPGKRRAPRVEPDTWRVLRAQVQRVKQAQGLDWSGLAERLGLTASTTRNAVQRRAAPSAAIVAKLRRFLEPAAAAPAVAGNGAASFPPAEGAAAG